MIALTFEDRAGILDLSEHKFLSCQIDTETFGLTQLMELMEKTGNA